MPPAEHALATQDVVYRTDLLEDRVARRLKLGISPAHSVLLERSFDLGPSKALPHAGGRATPRLRYKNSKVTFCSRIVSWLRCGAMSKGDPNGL